jgi:hypothetical protein
MRHGWHAAWLIVSVAVFFIASTLNIVYFAVNNSRHISIYQGPWAGAWPEWRLGGLRGLAA